MASPARRGHLPDGQGHVTTFSQIVADTMGVSFDDVDVLHGDTDVAAWGLNTYGSRSLVLGGAAVQPAAQKVVDKARLRRSHQGQLSANPTAVRP
jgi:carbon-monoxide dehydrogenase large subunit